MNATVRDVAALIEGGSEAPAPEAGDARAPEAGDARVKRVRELLEPDPPEHEGSDDAETQAGEQGQAAGAEAAAEDGAGDAGAGEASRDESPDDDADDADGADSTPGARTAADLAAAAGLSLEELHDTAFSMGDRGEVTLRELRDAYLDRAELEDEREAFGLERGEFDTGQHRERLELHQAREETRGILDLLSANGQLTQPVLEHVQQVQAHHQRREWNALTDAWPELADASTHARERERLWKVLRTYGYSRAEYEAMPDHRHMLVLRRLADLEERQASAQEELRQRRAATTPRERRKPRGRANGSQPDRTRRITAAKGSRDISKVTSGVRAILEGAE